MNNFYPLLSDQIIFLFFTLFFVLFISYCYVSVKKLILRTLIFIVLSILLLNPMINSSEKSLQNDFLILVYDKTQSIVDTNKLDQLFKSRDEIKNKIRNIENLELIEIEVNSDDEKNNEGIKTKIFTELTSKLQKIDRRRVAGIIIITDGIIHDLEKINSEYANIPLHFLLLGTKSERDRSIITKNVPDYAMVGKEISFLININDSNYSEEVITSFLLDGEEVLSKSLTPNIEHKVALPISHSGVNLLEIKINNHEDELTFNNNYKAFEINGIHEKLRVMLISGEPNMGLRNWRNILNSDPSVELLHFTILRPPSKRDLTPVKELALIPFPSQELFSADMSKFNLIILDQYTLQGILPKKYIDNIVNYVLNGGAVLSISGEEYLSDKSLMYSPLASILPTNPLGISNKAFLPSLTALGTRHPITNSLNNSYKNYNWGKWYSYVITNKKSGKTLMQANSHPLLVIDEISEGRVAQILSDQSWIWKKDKENRGPLVKLLRNTIHWLLKTPELQENFLEVGKTNDIISLSINTLSVNKGIASITLPSKKVIPINLKDNDNGILSGKFKTLEVGKFSINFGNVTKEFYIGVSNNIEAEYVKSSEKLLKDYFENNNQYMYSISWIQDNIPKIAKVYNKNNVSGKNWIGFLEKKVEKNDIFLKKELLNWTIFMPFLLFLFFVCWFRDAE